MIKLLEKILSASESPIDLEPPEIKDDEEGEDHDNWAKIHFNYSLKCLDKSYNYSFDICGNALDFSLRDLILMEIIYSKQIIKGENFLDIVKNYNKFKEIFSSNQPNLIFTYNMYSIYPFDDIRSRDNFIEKKFGVDLEGIMQIDLSPYDCFSDKPREEKDYYEMMGKLQIPLDDPVREWLTPFSLQYPKCHDAWEHNRLNLFVYYSEKFAEYGVGQQVI